MMGNEVWDSNSLSTQSSSIHDLAILTKLIRLTIIQAHYNQINFVIYIY